MADPVQQALLNHETNDWTHSESCSESRKYRAVFQSDAIEHNDIVKQRRPKFHSCDLDVQSN